MNRFPEYQYNEVQADVQEKPSYMFFHIRLLQNLTPAGTFFLFAAMCIPYMLIVWKLVPETTGKSLEEIERYWMKTKN